MMARRTASRLLAAAMVAASLPALACGVCIEDKVAVTYDHAVVQSAVARGHVVVFAAIETRSSPQVSAQSVRSAARRASGVDRASVRTASEPAALSFALDPRVQSPDTALSSIEKAAAQPGLRLTLLRVAR